MKYDPQSTDLAAAAQFFAGVMRYRVVPLADGDKRPRIKDWVKQASADADQVAQWWSQWPNANVGIALGTGSGIVAVDLDSDAGELLVLSLTGNEGLPDTLEMTTSAGKRRLLFAIPDSLDVEPATTAIADPAGGEAVRFQGTGGQCVMPPSLHPSGSRYAWAPGKSPADLAAAPMPGWLIRVMTPPEPVSVAANKRSRIRNEQEHHGKDAFEPAVEFNRRADWIADVLGPKGWKVIAKAGEKLYVCRPGKDGGVSATIGHYTARDGTPALFVFTSSVPEFEANHAYDKFGAYARLYHGGDHAAAGRALAAKGYGRLKTRAPQPVAQSNGEAAPQLVRPADTNGQRRVNASDLLHREFQPPKYAVDGLLGEGLTMLAGRPKQGKSWLAMLIGWAVAGGYPIDGRAVKPGNVLYLALEDNERRLQSRLRIMNDGLTWAVPPGLELQTLCPRADQGGLWTIAEWLGANNGSARLVIIDTLGRFRKPQKGAGNSYSEDYDALAEIKAILDGHGSCGLVVHHTRKQKAEDPLEEMSGTLAIAGAADGIWILDRTRGESTARLFAVSRDFPETTTPLTFDAAHCIWRFGPSTDGIDVTGRAIDPGRSKVQQCTAWLREFLKTYAYPSKEIVDAAAKAGFSFNSVKEAKIAMGKRGTGELVNVNRGGDQNNDWWSGLGPPLNWRLRPQGADQEIPH